MSFEEHLQAFSGVTIHPAGETVTHPDQKRVALLANGCLEPKNGKRIKLVKCNCKNLTGIILIYIDGYINTGQIFVSHVF
ncbi:hypothetical protein [uncultured Desulfosarcina sp.]|uniref:hypothetical protein n=1 Tax=uncultured Desulfosarcina sp. TaxID=218289 RepID=UPI0029C6AAB1|nr:hypothetical protein [uncultured Desulfosarcina sp.]